MAVQLAAVHAEDGGGYVACLDEESVSLVRQVTMHTRRAQWWSCSWPGTAAQRQECADAWHAGRIHVAFLEQDTPEEDATETPAADAPRIVLTLRTGTMEMLLEPMRERVASVHSARVLTLYALQSSAQIAALEAAMQQTCALLDTERAKYRDLLAANPPKTAKYSAASLVCPGRIR